MARNQWPLEIFTCLQNNVNIPVATANLPSTCLFTGLEESSLVPRVVLFYTQWSYRLLLLGNHVYISKDDYS